MSCSLYFDRRSFPMIRGGELQTYAVIGLDEPVYDLILDNDIQGFREAIRSKTVCISDRSSTGWTFLHVRESFLF